MDIFAAEWVGVFVLGAVGLIAAVAIYFMRSDPETRRYLPGSAGLFNLGRMRVNPDPDHERDKDGKFIKTDTPDKQ